MLSTSAPYAHYGTRQRVVQEYAVLGLPCLQNQEPFRSKSYVSLRQADLVVSNLPGALRHDGDGDLQR